MGIEWAMSRFDRMRRTELNSPAELATFDDRLRPPGSGHRRQRIGRAGRPSASSPSPSTTPRSGFTGVVASQGWCVSFPRWLWERLETETETLAGPRQAHLDIEADLEENSA